MSKDRTFKKELPREELLTLVLEALRQIENESDKGAIVRQIEDLCTKAVTGEWATLWLLGDAEQFYTDTLDTKKKIDISVDKGLLGKCYKERKPCFTHLAVENPDFDITVDNCANLPLKDIMVIPIVRNDQDIIALLQVANHQTDIQQFTSNDLNTLDIIGQHIKKIIHLVHSDDAGKDTKTLQAAVDEELQKTVEILEDKKRRAEDAVASSTQFLAEVAHEIRTPMNAVMGFMELLMADESDEQKLDYLDTAFKSGEMMVALINDLLDFSKIERGMMELESIEFNPIDEFASIGPLFCGRMKKNNIYFQTFIDPNLPKIINMDPYRIKQILSNLLGNAVKFTPEEGHVCLEIIYTKETASIEFSVKDSGKGIAEDQQTKIFNAFQQEKSSTAREHGGTGLGLSISQRLAKLLGGTLAVKSKEGEGSRFYFSVPLEKKIIDKGVFYNKQQVKKKKIALLHQEKSVADVLIRYFSAFGIAKSHVLELKGYDDVASNSVTHLFCSEHSLEMDKIQFCLDNNIVVVIMKTDLFHDYKNGLHGQIYEIGCTFSANQLYRVLQPENDLLLSEEVIEDPVTNKSSQKDHILVVDDNPINIQFFKAVATRLGVEVESAENGQKAVEVYEDALRSEHPFDLIFMDESMPRMNGTEATKKILEIEKRENHRHTTIIGLSGNATKDQRKISKEAGMEECIFKPVSIKVIKEMFERYLGGKHSGS